MTNDIKTAAEILPEKDPSAQIEVIKDKIWWWIGFIGSSLGLIVTGIILVRYNDTLNARDPDTLPILASFAAVIIGLMSLLAFGWYVLPHIGNFFKWLRRITDDKAASIATKIVQKKSPQ